MMGFDFGASSWRLLRKGNLVGGKIWFVSVLSLFLILCPSDIDEMRARFERRAPDSSEGARSSVIGDVDSDVFVSLRRFERLADGLERAFMVCRCAGEHDTFKC